MEDGRIPKDILYGELASGKRSVGRPQLRYKDVCKRDMKALDINTENWEEVATDRSKWRSVLHMQLKSGEEKILTTASVKRAKRKARTSAATPTAHTCSKCGRDCPLPYRTHQPQPSLPVAKLMTFSGALSIVDAD